jgi:hypothetical protein
MGGMRRSPLQAMALRKSINMLLLTDACARCSQR